MKKELIRIIDEQCMIVGDQRRINCQTVFEIAKKMNVDVSVIGDLCNMEAIKISSCQLGCFGQSRKSSKRN